MTPKPLVIVTPLEASQIQEAIKCSQLYGLQIRIRSGGHDYEGLSFVSDVPFVVIDLINLRSIEVDVENKSAWVQAGATVGEVYYRIAEKSKTLGFPAGVCPTMGVGGHFSGGGYGFLMRKYGLAADNIVDAQLIDVKVQRTLDQNATKLVHRWQYVADKLHEDLFIRVILQSVNSSQGRMPTIQASFNSMFLGGVDQLLPLIQQSFPELGLLRQDCIEMRWIETIPYFAGFSTGEPLNALLNRSQPFRIFFKGKSDYVKEPIPEVGLEGIWKKLHELEPQTSQLILSPYGGKMSEIPESEIPFPHRAGNIYKIQHYVYWREDRDALSQRNINWIRNLYSYLTPFVSKSPRAAYFNYRDLDIGINDKGNTSYKQASIWGIKYFKNNFNRLVHVKTMVDPSNFFKNEQSIPLLQGG
ncbi:FAD-binding Berberine family protein [Quillaja saponaria]|uniref:FAD-binding Berberine family protein n=1 Tax=Quillaja saponaria TaxID=32244 RepID=A0AAD7LQY3_QUISA|nr:FAD-binding Berberine family protein [Quillaja saponaria]